MHVFPIGSLTARQMDKISNPLGFDNDHSLGIFYKALQEFWSQMNNLKGAISNNCDKEAIGEEKMQWICIFDCMADGQTVP